MKKKAHAHVIQAVRMIMFVILATLIINADLRAVEGQPSDEEEILTNANIIEMKKDGFSDEVITNSIGLARKVNFDVSMHGLKALKDGGISQDVMAAMQAAASRMIVGEESSPAPREGKADTSRPAMQPGGTADPNSDLFPSAYGFYFRESNGMREMATTPVTTVFGLRPVTMADGGFAVNGLQGMPSVSIDEKTPTFFTYQQVLDVTTIRLSRLSFTESLQARQFNIQKTDEALFPSLYGRSPDDYIDVSLWRPEGDIELRISPVPEKPGLHSLTPRSPLVPGRYAFYSQSQIVSSNMVLSAPSTPSATAFYFGVPLSSQDLENACPDYNACIQSADADLVAYLSDFALAKLARATTMHQQPGEAYGRLAAVNAILGNADESIQWLDKLRSLNNGALGFEVCRVPKVEVFTSCKAGQLVVDSREVKFIKDGKTEDSAFLAEIANVENTPGRVILTITSSEGKKSKTTQKKITFELRGSSPQARTYAEYVGKMIRDYRSALTASLSPRPESASAGAVKEP